MGQRPQALEGDEQLVAPGPAARQVEDEAAGVPAEAASYVEQPVAEPLGLAPGKLGVGQQQPLRPDEEVLADQDELEPDGVGLKVTEGQVAKPALLAAADAVLAGGAGAVELLEAGGLIPYLKQKYAG